MSESDPTGYRESPDTTDGPVAEDQADDDGAASDATLTTDEEAQRDDSIMRPGNEPD
jgi:hypothetical protein